MDQTILDGFTRRAEAKAANHAAHLQEEVLRLKQEIELLLDKKHDIERSPIPISELIPQVKKSVLEMRKKYFIEAFIAPLLEKVQKRQLDLTIEVVRVNLVTEATLWRYVSTFLDDRSIEEACKMLTDKGTMSEKERTAKVASIEREIASLEEKIEKLLI